MAKLKPEMQQTLVTIPDLSDQPDSRYVLITGQLPRPMYYAVDGWNLMTNVVEFYREKPTGHREIIYMCRIREGQWAIVLRSAVDIVTKEELARHSAEDSDTTNRILKEIDPEMYEQAEKILKEQGIGLNATLDKPVPGQYL
jgi:hypothetical protein